MASITQTISGDIKCNNAEVSSQINANTFFGTQALLSDSLAPLQIGSDICILTTTGLNASAFLYTLPQLTLGDTFFICGNQQINDTMNGTWTGTKTDVNGSGTLSAQNNQYFRMGNKIYFNINLTFSAITSSTTTYQFKLTLPVDNTQDNVPCGSASPSILTTVPDRAPCDVRSVLLVADHTLNITVHFNTDVTNATGIISIAGIYDTN